MYKEYVNDYVSKFDLLCELSMLTSSENAGNNEINKLITQIAEKVKAMPTASSAELDHIRAGVSLYK